MADSPSPATSPKGIIRRRNAPASRQAPSRPPGGGNPGMMRMYTDDSPGVQVDPVVVLVLSLAFIASVFGLHIIGKFFKA